jgi:UDP-N-acetylglucosamine 2-epimerase (hydrolysing)
MRFEYFLTLLKNARFIIGNSSSGIREAPHFGVPCINLGSRQNNRVNTESVLNVSITHESIESGLSQIKNIARVEKEIFGGGNSAEEFHQVLLKPEVWNSSTQKYFIDRARVSEGK